MQHGIVSTYRVVFRTRMLHAICEINYACKIVFFSLKSVIFMENKE